MDITAEWGMEQKANIMASHVDGRHHQTSTTCRSKHAAQPPWLTPVQAARFKPDCFNHSRLLADPSPPCLRCWPIPLPPSSPDPTDAK